MVFKNMVLRTEQREPDREPDRENGRGSGPSALASSSMHMQVLALATFLFYFLPGRNVPYILKVIFKSFLRTACTSFAVIACHLYNVILRVVIGAYV